MDQGAIQIPQAESHNCIAIGLLPNYGIVVVVYISTGEQAKKTEEESQSKWKTDCCACFKKVMLQNCSLSICVFIGMQKNNFIFHN